MKKKLFTSFILTILLMLVFDISNLSRGESISLNSPVCITFFVTQPNVKDSFFFLVTTILNTSKPDSVINLKYQLLSNTRVIKERLLPVISANQPSILIDSLPLPSSNLYVKAIYFLKGKKITTVFPINPPKIIDDKFPWQLLFTVLVSFLGTTLGAWLIHKFTSKRDDKRIQFDWNKMLFEKYELAYRAFIKNWAGSQSLTTLKAQFDLLESNCIVPMSIKEVYKNTINTFENSQSSADEKQTAANNLLKSIESLVHQQYIS
jgi:hypothetical protein